MLRIPRNLDSLDKKRIEDELKDAFDFDPKDPLFGLSQTELGGPTLRRRTVLRLMAAAGTLTMAHLLPGVGLRGAEAAAKSGGELTAGWAGVGELRTFDGKPDQFGMFKNIPHQLAVFEIVCCQFRLAVIELLANLFCLVQRIGLLVVMNQLATTE